jgi:hypothetical protein
VFISNILINRFPEVKVENFLGGDNLDLIPWDRISAAVLIVGGLHYELTFSLDVNLFYALFSF